MSAPAAPPPVRPPGAGTEPSRPVGAAPALTAAAPWVRAPGDVRRALLCLLVATSPCLAMALYNTGHQWNLALAGGAAGTPSGWRSATLAALGRGHSPESIVDCAVLGGLVFAPMLLAVALAGGLAQAAFARARGRSADRVGLATFAVLLTLSLPAGASFGQAALAAAVGLVLGRELFGGLGRSFLSPVVVALAFLLFAQAGALRGEGVWLPLAGSAAPDPLATAIRAGRDGLEAAGLSWEAAALGRVPGPMGQTSAAACALGLGVLLWTGVASWRVVAGGLLGLAAGVWALQGLGADAPIAALPWHWHLVTGSFAFGLVYLATDPTASATTNPGRWIHGALVGGLVAVVRIANGAYEDGVILALLLASVSAPLVDRGVAAVQLARRRSPHRG